MYTKEELSFMNYWKEERVKKKRIFKQILLSLPIGIIIVAAIFINYFSGWYKRATMVANADPSLFIILIIAGILIVAFIAVFASYHKWDINETRYKELLSRESSKKM
ncbi:MAG: hypothetical protein ACK5NK_04675 [Niabella sp.]